MKHASMTAAVAIAAALIGVASPAFAEEGVTDTEVKIGTTAPYSGPASAFGVVGQAVTAYFKMVNDQGGIAGRKIDMISLDDGYSPPKAVEATRQLVERDGVLAMFGVLGTATNIAIRDYLNAKKVPQLYTSTGATALSIDPVKYRWTVGWTPTYRMEGVVYGRHILQNHPDGKIGILMQNDDFGRDYLAGLKEALGDKASTMIVSEQTYDTSEPTVNSQVISLQASGADVLVNISTPKFAAQAIRKVAELNWKPVHYLSFVSSSLSSVIQPAGVENAQDIITVQFTKDPSDPKWANDEGLLKWRAFMDKYLPGVSQTDNNVINGYSMAETLHHTLEKAGRDLTRESLLKAAESLDGLQLSMFLPGVTLSTSETNHAPVTCLKMATFKGESWVGEGDLICP